MAKKIILDIFKLLLPFAVLWGVFSYWNPLEDTFDIEFSVENEEQLAELLHADEITGMIEIHDDTLDAAMHEILMRLEKGIELTDYDYKIHVVKNDQVNAFATIAGHLFVNTGFIEFVETPEEIAAVLAHEIGHIEHRHVIRKLVKELGIAIVFGVLTGDNGEFVRDMSRAMLSTGFDRGQEADADNFAFDLLTKVNLKPTHIATFFRRLKEKGHDVPAFMELFSTHPNHNSRIKSAIEFPLPEDFEEDTLNIDLEALQTACKRY